MVGDSSFPLPDVVAPPVTALPTDADVTERLLAEFEATYGLCLVSGVIRSCRAELRNTVATYPPESLEALVRSRLPVAALAVEAGAA